MPLTHSITQKRLKELLRYDPATGLFTRLVSRNGVKAGDVAGNPDSHGYIQIGIDGLLHRAHRLAFLYMEGCMPEQVDHDDQVRCNNKWKNLNPATNSLNMKNQKLRSTNISGTCGVYWIASSKKWRARIMVDNQGIHLGLFSNKRDAIAARQAANIKYGFHKNHGRI